MPLAQVMINAHHHASEFGMRGFRRVDMNRNQIRIHAGKFPTGVGHASVVRSNAAVGRKAIGMDACSAADHRPGTGLYRMAVMRPYPAHTHLTGPADHRQHQGAAIAAA